MSLILKRGEILETTQKSPSVRQWLGHRVREALLMPAILRKAHPKVAFFPSSPGTGAGHLRASLVAQQLRRMGWNAVSVPAQLELMQRERFLKRLKPDVLVFQKCRHPFNDPAHSFGVPFILDIDDADFHDSKMEQRLQQTATQARGVIAGSRYIRSWAGQFNKTCAVVWTGTPISAGERLGHSQRGDGAPVITWAQASPLGYPSELAFVTDVLRRVARQTDRFSLRFYGINSDKDRAEITGAISLPGVRIDTRPSLPYHEFLLSLRSVSIGLSPIVAEEPFSRGKSFGKVLGYLDAMVPVVCSDHADHSMFFTTKSGYVSNSPQEWEQGILNLLHSVSLREEISANAFSSFRQRLSIERSSELVGKFIRAII